ncbi:NAD(P)-binding domain-containing protein [Paractinoplanes globisporus]|uniref:NAD(P)-binding domain-containing protein n=1 Tax=Paractinoplanes globisporus TaxID=113565 RepID=A0ABW6WDR0_9ACTN|nr:NAD(P)/FAD-dependent oxidoreductase [Actinoplanes globisporus]
MPHASAVRRSGDQRIGPDQQTFRHRSCRTGTSCEVSAWLTFPGIAEGSAFYFTYFVGTVAVTVAIIGAGPYGLSIAAHLRSLGVQYRIFGVPIDTWARHVPAGMLLKSDGFASSLSDPDGKGTLANYCSDQGLPYHDTDLPVKVDVFVDYARDFQQRFVPDLEERQVVSLDKEGDVFTLVLDDGETLTADLVVNAVGITHFGRMPDELKHLPESLATHSAAHHDLSGYAGKNVHVIGGGASAVDIAVLLSESGAETSLIVRSGQLKFASPPSGRPRSRWDEIKAPSSGLGPGWRSWLCQNRPGLFRYLPGSFRTKVVRRHLGPASGWPMKARMEAGVKVSVGTRIEQASEVDGRVRLVLRSDDGSHREVVTDHVIAATGYWPDVERLSFVSERVRRGVRTHAGLAMLSGTFETSVDGLYIVGPAAADSFGPLMRFMVGAEYVAPLVARRLARRARKEPARGVTTA